MNGMVIIKVENPNGTKWRILRAQNEHIYYLQNKIGNDWRTQDSGSLKSMLSGLHISIEHNAKGI